MSKKKNTGVCLLSSSKNRPRMMLLAWRVDKKEFRESPIFCTSLRESSFSCGAYIKKEVSSRDCARVKKNKGYHLVFFLKKLSHLAILFFIKPTIFLCLNRVIYTAVNSNTNLEIEKMLSLASDNTTHTRKKVSRCKNCRPQSRRNSKRNRQIKFLFKIGILLIPRYWFESSTF